MHKFEEVVSPRAASGNMTVGQSGRSRWALSEPQVTAGQSGDDAGEEGSG